jgi:hypothetical protein
MLSVKNQGILLNPVFGGVVVYHDAAATRRTRASSSSASTGKQKCEFEK